MARTKTILFVVNPGSGWMGGTYYVRNLLATLLHNSEVRKWNLLVLCPDEHREIFSSLESNGNVKLLRRHSRFSKINFFLMKAFRVLRRDFPLDIVMTALIHRVDAIFPVMGYPIFGLGRRCVHWIPDFQHNKIPEFFTPRERIQKDGRFESIGKSGNKLILSSHDAATHFRDFYPGSTAKVSVIPFISDIEEWVGRLTPRIERDVLAKFCLLEGDEAARYLYVPNQFWRHKNHITAFRGFAEYLRRHPESRLLLVCTGNTKDYRHANFFESLQRELGELNLGESVRILSFLKRQEQMVVLKHCRALLQPSLFEGWGTGVQEAKRFARPLILSDLPIHREQGNDRTVYFSATDPQSLAEAIEGIESMEFPALSDDEIRKSYFEDAARYAKDAHYLLEDCSP